MSRPCRYSLKEVQALVEGYAEWRELRSTHKRGLAVLVRLADLDRAIRQLPPKEYRAVLLHGLLRLSARYVAEFEGCHNDTVLYRYHAGLSWIKDYLNGVTN